MGQAVVDLPDPAGAAWRGEDVADDLLANWPATRSTGCSPRRRRASRIARTPFAARPPPSSREESTAPAHRPPEAALRPPTPAPPRAEQEPSPPLGVAAG